MLINPKTAIKEGWITWNDKITDIERYIQPNAIDFDCAEIRYLDITSPAFLSEQSKIIHTSTIVEPENNFQIFNNGELQRTSEVAWRLVYGNCYDFSSNFHVTLPEGVAAELIIRSTLNRSGVFLTAGLYDSGFNGNIAGMLRIEGGDFYLAPNTRIGQIKFIRSEESGIMYAGGYNHDAGTHWTAKTQNSER